MPIFYHLGSHKAGVGLINQKQINMLQPVILFGLFSTLNQREKKSIEENDKCDSAVILTQISGNLIFVSPAV